MLKQRRYSFTLISVLFLLLACNLTSVAPKSDQASTESPEEKVGEASLVDDTNTPPPAGSASLDCEIKGYPCSYAEAEPAALTRADALLTEVATMVGEAGDLSSAAAYLESLEEVVEIIVDESTLVFRVENVPPFVIFHPDVEPDYEAASTRAPGSNFLARPALAQFSGDDGPIGLQPPGNEPKKRALVLSLYLWQFKNDEGDDIAALLSKTSDYDCEGCIDYVENLDNPKERTAGNFFAGPGIENFMGWQNYDLVHVVTHGRQICSPTNESDCMSLIQTGRYVGGFSFLEDTKYLSMRGLIYGASSKLPPGWRYELVSSDFFRSTYPGGLPDTILFFSACQSMKSTDLADSLIADNTAVLGWSESVFNNPATEISLKFYEYAVDEGLQAQVAYDKTKSFSGYQYGFERANADLLVKGAPEPRGREVITLLHPFYRTELKENSAATTTGTAADGENDTLLLAIQIEGVDESLSPGEYKIHISVNGREADQTFTADRSAGEYKYQTGLISVPLPIDVDNKKTVTVEAWAELPEGGQTRHYIENVLPAGCGWNGLMNSTQKLQGNEVLVINHPEHTFTTNADLLKELGLDDASQLTEGELLTFVFGSDKGYPTGTASEAGGSIGLSPMDIYGTQNLNLDVNEIGGSIYGTVSGSYLGVSGNITYDGEFYWHADSRCSFAIKQAAVNR